MRETIYTINRGSDLDFVLQWPDNDGNPMDLTGWSVSVFEPSNGIADHVSALIVDAETGTIQVRIEWQDGNKGRGGTFRLQVSQGTENASTNTQRVVYE